jgi:hypothetical protein
MVVVKEKFRDSFLENFIGWRMATVTSWFDS